MLIIFDQATPLPIRPYLEQHTVRTAAQQGWDKLSNGDLLTAAEEAGFDILLTTDRTYVTSRISQVEKSRSLFWDSSNGHNLNLTFSASSMPSMRPNPAVTSKWTLPSSQFRHAR